MKPSEALNLHREEIREIAARHHAKSVKVFGSVIIGKDTENSDLDLLVEPMPEMTLMDIGAIRYKLHHLLGVSIDVLTPKSLPKSFRQIVLSQAVRV